MNRVQVLDEYNRYVRLECPECNRGRGARPLRMTIVEHLEAHLGPVCEGWGTGQPKIVTVVRFRNQPSNGASAYSTLGLSNHILQLHGGRDVRMELVFAAYDTFDAKAIASFLSTFTDHLLATHSALLRGQVVGPSTPIIPGVKMSAVYASTPVVFGEAFETYKGTSPSTVLVWLIPLLPEEARYIQQRGWKTFENLIEEKDPDLLDLCRMPVI